MTFSIVLSSLNYNKNIVTIIPMAESNYALELFFTVSKFHAVNQNCNPSCGHDGSAGDIGGEGMGGHGVGKFGKN